MIGTPESRRTFLTALGTTLSGCGVREADRSTTTDPDLIGHRGCAGEYPENTVRAVKAASSVVDAVEIDVRRCGTGELVVFHDETLDRTTDRAGSIRETDCDELRDLEVENSGEPVPRLRDVFEAVPGNVGVVAELKERGLASDALSIAAEYDHDLLVSSFDERILEELRTVDPAVPTAYIVRESRRNRVLRPIIPDAPDWLYFSEDVDGMIATAVDRGCDALHPRYELCLQTDLVDRAHDAGLRVDAWTITSRAEADAVSASGVDGLISDVCSTLRG